MSDVPPVSAPGDKTMSDHARETASRAAAGAGDVAHDAARHFVREPAADLFSLAKQYARDKPDVAACWAFALGVVVGWKLKP
ncbi:hypothetical protein [Allorhodopirellula heiligendammensis]|uniref:DUF883 domain-containing protein n=1 Tax=Allorhodopirellula heiligendammensis TaxID=2714739 RepID=A0A5C6BVA0_9BACT|nr:hypothetical protein [Allorhodopirellula heiligendammensis]TWU16203.1 hypothetical protein Poly21_34080 [Allorhodopirellula heiligendammensis]|tara:strand:- start:1032 stop:1277 length:246 start_codon:yes stop_codon:yes gene_type:complete